MRSANIDSRNAQDDARRKNHLLQNTEEEPITLGTTPTPAHRRYLSSPPAATLHGKAQGFVLRLPHTALHQCIVMWCRVSHRPSSMYCSLTILFVRNSEDCFVTSFRQSSNLTKSTTPPKQNSFLFRACSFAELPWLQKAFRMKLWNPLAFSISNISSWFSLHKSS